MGQLTGPGKSSLLHGFQRRFAFEVQPSFRRGKSPPEPELRAACPPRQRAEKAPPAGGQTNAPSTPSCLRSASQSCRWPALTLAAGRLFPGTPPGNAQAARPFHDAQIASAFGPECGPKKRRSAQGRIASFPAFPRVTAGRARRQPRGGSSASPGRG